jgi:hypothetical protein
MDQYPFRVWTHAFGRTPSRREVLRGLAGVGLSLGGLRLSEVEAAKNKPKKRKKRKGKKQTPIPSVTPPPVTGPPPPGRKVGTCSALRNRCSVVDPGIATCDPANESSACLVTTSGELFCGTLFGFQTSVNCKACDQDADCVALGFPPGSACVQLGGQFCNGCEATNNRACLPTAIPD